MSEEVIQILQGSAAVNSTDTVYSAADIRRAWTSGGYALQGSAVINDTDNIYKGTDIRREWSPGGLNLQGRATLNDTDNIYRGTDIRREWTPGGLTLQGSARVNDTDSVYVGTDMIRIVFVTLTEMSESFNIILDVMRSRAIPFMQKEVTTIAWCWKLVRKDGVVMGFTNHDEDIVYDGIRYKASTGFAPTAVSTSDNMSVDNLDANSMVSDESITEQDLRNGVYTNCEIQVMLLDYTNLREDPFILRRGTIGEISYGSNQFTAEIRGLMESYQQKSGMVTTRQCRANFCDSKCKLYARNYTYTGSVTAIDTEGFYISVRQADDFFSYGIITFTSGDNNGARMEVKKYSSTGQVKTFLPLEYPVKIGDTFSIIAGCDGNATTCRNRFNNLVNFRGEIYTPGNNYAVSYPVSTSGNIVSEGESPRRATYNWG